MSTIGIIGAGKFGRAIATILARHDIPAVLSNSRGPDSLKAIISALGPSITAGAREEAAAQDIVFVAVNWSKLPAALAGLPNWQGRIVVDANNPIEAPLFQPAELKGRLSTEIVEDLVPGAGHQGVQPSSGRLADCRSSRRRRRARTVLFGR